MNDRKRDILNSLIEEYTKSALPVSSSALVKKYNFDLSPATIRHEMVELEKEGFLHQPHISAGRIPTDRAYRFYINSLTKKENLSKKEQAFLQEELMRLKIKYQRLLLATAKLLANLSHNLAISGFLGSHEYFKAGMSELLKEPEFNNINHIQKVIEIVDLLDEEADKIFNKSEGKLKVYIGRENPVKKIEDYSMIVSGFHLSVGGKVLIVVLGPKRMHYKKNISLVGYVTKLIKGSFTIVICFNLLNYF